MSNDLPDKITLADLGGIDFGTPQDWTPTPHPAPPPSDDTSALNREIATLRGWHDAVTVDPEGNEHNIVRNDETDEEEYDWDALPDYASDPAAAFELLQHCQTIRGVSRGKVMDNCGGIKFTIYNDTRQVVEWSVWRGPNGYAEADTLTEAIARACHAALAAIKGDRDDGTN